MQKYWIWLTRRRGIGAMKVRRLLAAFGSVEELYFADRGELARAGLSPAETETLLDKRLDETMQIKDQCFLKGVGILTLSDPDYPACLKAIPDPPAVLYLKGRLPKVDALPTVAVVGTRKPSVYGAITAKRLGYQLARCGGVVITGMAVGVDGLAAEGALLGEGTVVGVMGCGVDVAYPKRNLALLEEVRSYGCLISEYPPGTQPFSGNFPQRNRIISGLSDGVVVVQAGEKSGALITAQHALEQGRDVYAVPGPVDEPASAGCNLLLREGAGLITSGYDVLAEYANRYPGAIRENRDVPAEPSAAPAAPEPQAKPEPPPSAVQPPRKPPAAGPLSPDEETVLKVLGDGTLQLDAVIDAAQLPAARVLAALTLLEIKNYVNRLPGKHYVAAH